MLKNLVIGCWREERDRRYQNFGRVYFREKKNTREDDEVKQRGKEGEVLHSLPNLESTQEKKKKKKKKTQIRKLKRGIKVSTKGREAIGNKDSAQIGGRGSPTRLNSGAKKESQAVYHPGPVRKRKRVPKGFEGPRTLRRAPSLGM